MYYFTMSTCAGFDRLNFLTIDIDSKVFVSMFEYRIRGHCMGHHDK